MIEWVLEHLDVIAYIAAAVVALGVAIAAVTPNKTDDKIFGFLARLLGKPPAPKPPEVGSAEAPLLTERPEHLKDEAESPEPSRLDSKR